MTRTVTMDQSGNFAVSDDPEGVIAVALLVATTPENCGRIATELGPDGNGLHVQGIGSIDRIASREQLPYGFEDDASLDPDTQELWRLFREPDHEYPDSGRWVLSGDELRELVARAVALRAQPQS